MMEETKILTGEDAVMFIGKKYFGEKFNLDEGRREKYEKAYFVFSCTDPKAEYEGMRAKKGLFLTGHIGVGKTTMMNVMQRLFKDTDRRFKLVNCLQIKDMLEECKVAEIKDWYGKNLKCDLYLDDIGLGQVNYNQYGNSINIISELIYERYELFVSDGFKTHMSTNIPTTVPKDAPANINSIARMYGDRILDRIAQMTNLIEWTGKTLRRN